MSAPLTATLDLQRTPRGAAQHGGDADIWEATAGAVAGGEAGWGDPGGLAAWMELSGVPSSHNEPPASFSPSAFATPRHRRVVHRRVIAGVQGAGPELVKSVTADAADLCGSEPGSPDVGGSEAGEPPGTAVPQPAALIQATHLDLHAEFEAAIAEVHA